MLEDKSASKSSGNMSVRGLRFLLKIFRIVSRLQKRWTTRELYYVGQNLCLEVGRLRFFREFVLKGLVTVKETIYPISKFRCGL